MITDKNGKQLQVGDEVVVRGKIIGVPMQPVGGNVGLLQVEWTTGAPWLDFVQPNVVEKAGKE